MLVPVFLLVLLGMLEFGLVFDHQLTLTYATREGARTGSALANGSGLSNCSDVDAHVIAAVQRVLTAPGSPIAVDRISEIHIFRANSSGVAIGGDINRWTYAPGLGPSVDGAPLDFRADSVSWPSCGRDNGSSPDSIGVGLTYSYRLQTPLPTILGFFGPPGGLALTVSDRSVMALNPTD